MIKRVGFLACSGIGYLIAHFFGDGPLTTYAAILISYHLYLAFLVVIAEKETRLSLPIGHTILTHLACLAAVIGLAVGRHYIPFFSIVRLFIPGLAPFEVGWLFSGSAKKPAPGAELSSGVAVLASTLVAEAPAAVAVAPGAAVAGASAALTTSLYDSSTGEEYEEFLKLMQAGKRPYRKPGLSVREEYEMWLAARSKQRAAAVPSRAQA
jgi:hypothetical protein